MTGRLVIMASFQNGAAERIICRHVDATFVCEDAGFDLPVGKARAKGERNVLVHRLESLEDEGVTCRGRFDAVGEGGVDEVNEKGGWKEGDVGVVGVICREKVGATGEGIGSG